MNIQKPILKWVGGKTQIINKIIDKFPNEFNNYHEIFLGGGSVLFGFLSLVKNNKIKLNGNVYAYDLNLNLINFYKIVQKKPRLLFMELEKIKEIYNKIVNFNGNKT